MQAQTPGPLTVVHAATYFYQIAPGSLASAFGTNLPANASVSVCTPGSPPSGCVAASVVTSTSSQVNFLVPDGITANPVVVEVLSGGTVAAEGSVPLTTLSPGIFTVDDSGHGIFAGEAYDQNANDAVFQSSGSASPATAKPISASSGDGPNVLIIYGTGWKNVNPANVQVNIGGTNVTPEYIGPSHQNGLDQLNVAIPSSLVGQSSKIVDIFVTVTHAADSTTGKYTTNKVEFCLSGQDGSACPAVTSAPTPLCTEPLQYLGAPYAPHGIFALEFPGQGDKLATSNIINAGPVCGGNLYVLWSQIDSGNGNYDWSSVDARIQPWLNAGKKVNLIIWGVTEGPQNNATPAYVQQDPGYQSVSCTSNGSSITVPVYYSPGYKNNYKTFIQATMAKYGSDPEVGYIRFGLAQGGEAFPACLQQLLQLAGDTSIDQFNARFEQYITEMTQFEKQLQTAALDSAGFTVQIMQPVNIYGNPPQYAVTDFEAQNAKALGFGFGSQGLNLRDLTSLQNGTPCTANWCSHFESLLGYVPLELQTLGLSDPSNAAGGPGSLPVLFPFALMFHTQIFEVYIQDLQVAYEPGTKNYDQYHAAYQQAFQQVANYVGYGSQP